MTVPALRALRRVLPDAHITLATRAWAEGLFAGAEFLDAVLPHQRHLRHLRNVTQQARAWRERKFDLALLLPNSFEAALVAGVARVPVRVGYAGDWRKQLLTHPVTRPAWKDKRHEVFYYLNLVAALENLLYGHSVIAQEEPDYRLTVSPARQQQARDLLAGPLPQAQSASCQLLAFCPGSTNSRAKRWPAESYAQLGDILTEQAGVSIILIGSADEYDVCAQVAALMRAPALNLAGRTKLAESVALLSLCAALVTNDTGPAHIAAALGIPAFVIFGPTNPTTTRPYGPNAHVIREPPDCAPCMLRDCPIDHRCMTAVTPARIFQQLGETISTLKNRH
jgi:heptosyltransferase-2